MPGSWEIAKIGGERVLLGILVPPDMVASFDYVMTMRQLQLPPHSDVIKVVGLPWDAARNHAAKKALEMGVNLAFLDADVRVQSPDAFIQLLNTRLPIVSGLYYQRFWPFLPCFFTQGRDEKGNHTKVPITGWKPGDIVPATFIPGGLLVVRREALEKMFARFPRPWTWGVDIAPIPDYDGGQVPPFSEDFNFSYRASTQLGIQPFVATSVIGFHEVRAVVGPRWVLPLASPDPLHGVCGIL